MFETPLLGGGVGGGGGSMSNRGQFIVSFLKVDYSKLH